MKLYNHLTEKVEKFIPKNPRDVKVYSCGPTVYDVPHLGHARTFIFIDTIVRILEFMHGYKVRWVMNITDIDDKIIAKGNPDKISAKYTDIFFSTMDLLNVRRPSFTPKVIDFIPMLKTIVTQLPAKKIDSSEDVYFNHLKASTRVFPSTIRRDEKRVETPSDFTREPRDFVLWRQKKWIHSNGDHMSSIPGWHLECAGLASLFLNSDIDIHLGGIDLKFPHHENEITLGRYLSKTDWVRHCWYIHPVTFHREKMSKSTKNFVSVQSILEEKYSPLTLRWYVLSGYYNNPIEFTTQRLDQAETEYNHFVHLLKRLETKYQNSTDEILFQKGELDFFITYQTQIFEALNEELKTPIALSYLINCLKELNHKSLSKSSLRVCLDGILEVARDCLGLILSEPPTTPSSFIPLVASTRFQIRELAVMCPYETIKQKLFEISDHLRSELYQSGYVVEDE